MIRVGSFQLRIFRDLSKPHMMAKARTDVVGRITGSPPPANTAEAAGPQSKTCLRSRLSEGGVCPRKKTPTWNQSLVKTQNTVSLGAGGCVTAHRSSRSAQNTIYWYT